MVKVLFWNCDTQRDFMYRHGKLYVPDAEQIIPYLTLLTRFAKEKRIPTINTADYHTIISDEISDYPDFKTKFPAHCMSGSLGAEFIPETMPDPFDTIQVLYNNGLDLQFATRQLNDRGYPRQHFTIYKDHINAFRGNPHTQAILDHLFPRLVVMYGVATEFCVHEAVVSLLKQDICVGVVEDAIKGLTKSSLNDILPLWTRYPHFQGLWKTQDILTWPC